MPGSRNAQCNYNARDCPGSIEMPELRVFYDLLSQPCRAVVLFLEVNKIPYESVLISLREGKREEGNLDYLALAHADVAV